MIDQAAILQDIRKQLGQCAQLCVAYSGGLDSTVLLYLAAQFRQEVHVHAIHVNHQLSPNADAWQKHCEQQSTRLGVDLQCARVEVANHGQGLEQAARAARYEAFKGTIGESDLLVMGHHANDQAETFLYRLMRGAGLSGLSAIAPSRMLNGSKIYRPLLKYSREDIEAFANEKSLTWIDDESNQDLRFDRNYLRNEIVSRLQARWPEATNKITQSSQWLAESRSLLAEYAEEDLQRCHRASVRFGECIQIDAFSSFSFDRQKHLIRHWCESLGFSAPDASQLEQLSNVINAKEDASPNLEWGGCALRRYQGCLFLVSRSSGTEKHDQTFQIALGSELLLSDGSILHCHSASRPNELQEGFSVGFRREGIRCKPSERGHSQTLKKLFQEYQLEPWLRERIPLVYCGDVLVAVGDLFVCDHGLELPSDLQFEWQCPAIIPGEFD